MDRLSRMYCTIVSVITDFIFEHIALAHKTATVLYVKQYNIIIYLKEVQFLFDTVIFTVYWCTTTTRGLGYVFTLFATDRSCVMYFSKCA